MSELVRPLAGRRRQTLIAAIPLLLFVVVAIVGPILVPYDPITTHTGERLRPPLSVLDGGKVAVLGTDQVGRDVFAQVLQGARISLLVAAATILAAGTIGLLVGVLAGYYGRAFDMIAMRVADIQLGFPTILLAILIAGVIGRSVTNVIITLAIARWVTYARVARASTLATRELEFIHAARAIGATDSRVLLRHIVPATLTPLAVIATLEVGLVMISEASLSFLGLGTPPDQASWGLIIANGRGYLDSAWWIAAMPGLALSSVVVAVAMLGDRLRDYLDPHAAAAAR
jgi:peptide/nickel transport system permease protein